MYTYYTSSLKIVIYIYIYILRHPLRNTFVLFNTRTVEAASCRISSINLDNVYDMEKAKQDLITRLKYDIKDLFGDLLQTFITRSSVGREANAIDSDKLKFLVELMESHDTDMEGLDTFAKETIRRIKNFPGSITQTDLDLLTEIYNGTRAGFSFEPAKLKKRLQEKWRLLKPGIRDNINVGERGQLGKR